MKSLWICLLFLLTACDGERIQNAPDSGTTIQLPEIEWRIVNQAELERVYQAAGMPLSADQKLYGFAATQGEKRIVYTLPPSNVDDAATVTLGHEILHVAIGDYHKEH